MKQSPGRTFDVAIVGLGPSGAVAAALLAQSGLRVLAIDRLAGIYDKPRALALDHEILRVFQQLGIEEQLAQHYEPFTPSEYFGCDGQLIRRMTMVDPPYPLGYTPSNVFNQPALEGVLREHLRHQAGLSVLLETDITSVRQDAEGVDLAWRSTAGAAGAYRAAYVIGCDGASSQVRSWMGSALEDLGFDEPWLVVDVIANQSGLQKLPTTSVQYCEPARPASFLIGPGNHRRWEIAINPGEDPQEMVTPERTWELLSRWISPGQATLWRQSSYRFHALVADRWRNGRIFIAGDAAHQQPPFLGQGMCQGIRDVANLAWKLDAVIEGRVTGTAADDLLNSYGTERSRHVRELTDRIKRIGAVICERDPGRARERDVQLLAQCNGQVIDTPRQDLMPKLEEGFLTDSGASGVGAMFPQPWIVRDGLHKRFDAMGGPGWWLVLRTGTEYAPLDIQELKTVRLGRNTGEFLEADGVAEDWFMRNGCCAALVRPDRYVFGTAQTPSDIHGLVDEWLERLGLAAHPVA